MAHASTPEGGKGGPYGRDTAKGVWKVGKHKHRREDESFPCPQGQSLGGLFGGDSGLFLIILLLLFLFCCCDRDGGDISLDSAPVKLLESWMKSKEPATA